MQKRVVVIANPTSRGGRSKERIPELEQRLDQLGLNYEIHHSTSLPHAVELARDFGREEITVAAFGGDGLVGAIAGALAESKATFAVLPAGRGNDFARSIGIPSDPIKACELITEGTVKALDVAYVNGEAYLGMVNVGLISEISRIANETKILRGPMVYLYSLLKALKNWQMMEFEFEIDGVSYRRSGYAVEVANTSYQGGGMKVAPQADPSDGLLDIIAVGKASKLAFILNIPRIFKGTYISREDIELFRGKHVKVTSNPHSLIYADGEELTQAPIEVTVKHAVLKTVVKA